MSNTNTFNKFRAVSAPIIDFYAALHKNTDDKAEFKLEVPLEYYKVVNQILKNSEDIKHFIVYFRIWHLCLLNQTWFNQLMLPYVAEYEECEDKVVITFRHKKEEKKEEKFIKVVTKQSKSKYRDEVEVSDKQTARVNPFNLYISKLSYESVTQAYMDVNNQINRFVRGRNNEALQALECPKYWTQIQNAFNMDFVNNPDNHDTFIEFMYSIQKAHLLYYFGYEIALRNASAYSTHLIFHYNPVTKWHCKKVSEIPVGFAKINFDMTLDGEESTQFVSNNGGRSYNGRPYRGGRGRGNGGRGRGRHNTREQYEVKPLDNDLDNEIEEQYVPHQTGEVLMDD